MSAPRPPEYILKAMDKLTNDKSRVGAGWCEKDGSISLILDRFVTLSGRDSIVLKLFPNDYQDKD